MVCNYTIRGDLDRAFKETAATKAFVITDYFRAASSNADLEFQQGRDAIDAAKAAGVGHLIFMSVADAECFDKHTKHLKAKVVPDALSAEDWFRFHNRYADGTPIAT